MSDKTWVTGEFVETVQLQVVCQTLINKLAPDATEISMAHLEAYGSLDKALQLFYEDSLKEVVEKTRDVLRREGQPEIKEGALRTWFEKKLITPAHTRGLAYRGATHTEGLRNEAIDVLDQAHIVREERRGSGRWYELSHDRFIDPIRVSNKEWLVQYSGAAKTRQWLEEKATRWQQTQSEGDLLAESELPEAERWIASSEATELGYDPAVTNLIQQSRTIIKNRQRQRELEFAVTRKLAKSARRFKWASVGLATMFILALVTTLIASAQWRSAQANLQLAQTSFELAATREKAAEESKKEALEWATRELAAKKEAARRAQEAEDAKAEAERTKAKLAEALKKAEDRAREAERARKTDRLSREAFRLSRRPENREEAVAQFANAIKVYEQTGDRDAQADSYLNQGQVYKDMGEEERAEEAFNHALEIYRRKDPLKQANTLNNIGIIYSSASDATSGSNEDSLATAKAKFYSALTIYRAHKDIFGEAATLSNLGDAQLNLGTGDDRRRAVDYYSQAGDIYTNQVNRKMPGSQRAMKALAVMFLAVGGKFSLLAGADESFTLDDRLEIYQEALIAYDALNDTRGRAIALTRKAEVAQEALETADNTNAERYRKQILLNYSEAADLYKHCGDPIGEAGAHIRLGDYYQTLENRDEWRKAIDEYGKALSIYRHENDRAGQIRAHKLLYEFFAKSSEKEDKESAVKVLTEMNRLYRDLDNIRGQSDTYLRLGAIYESRQERSKAQAVFRDAQNLYHSSGDLKSEADILGEIGKVYAKTKDRESIDLAVEKFTEAVRIYKNTESTEALAKTYDKLADIYRDQSWNTAASREELTALFQKSIEYYMSEAQLYSDKPTKNGTLKLARIKRLIASVYRDRLMDKEKALDYLNQSLKLYEEGRSPGVARQIKYEIERLQKTGP